jgi:hypothetical protein
MREGVWVMEIEGENDNAARLFASQSSWFERSG